LRPIYKQTASYGHFGRSEKEFTWEAVGKKDVLAQAGRVAGSGNGQTVKARKAVRTSPVVAA